ncbi:MAG: heavy metal translocating P-type ATPase [Burkholderiales bacterium]
MSAPGIAERARPADPSSDAGSCWHCGARNPRGGRWRTEIGGASRTFCCAGCLAVARTIAGAGLERYYAARTGASPGPACTPQRAEWGESARAAGLLRPGPDGEVEVSLLLDGLTCGACVWLVETWLARTPGVTRASVNFATRRARVAWREGEATLDGVLASIDAIGYRAHPYDPRRREEGARREQRALLLRLGVSMLGMMQVMMFSVPGYLSDDGVAPEHQRLLDWASLVITLPVLVYAGRPFFTGAWRDARVRRLGMDVPIALGLGAAFAASAWSTLHAGGPVYYDSVTMFIALVTLARTVEFATRQRAVAAIERAARAMPATAERLDSGASGPATTVAAAALVAGDLVLVRPGAVVPADGTVAEGEALVEEAMLTGESWPRPRRAGERVLAGSVTRDAALVVRVDAVGEATELAAVLRLVDRAASSRPNVARLADRAASVFVAVLLAVAGLTAAAWLVIDPARALEVTFALLVVSCPCALSLATPSALAAAAGALGRRGVVLARADALETLARVSRVVFDKTGTLTHGRVRLARTAVFGRLDREAALSLAAALEARSEHPIARAIAAAGPGPAEGLVDPRTVVGRGIEGRIGGRRLRIGRAAFVAELSGAEPADLARFAAAECEGTSVVALGDETGFLAAFAFGDDLRDDARDAVARLHAIGVRTTLLSGDVSPSATACARAAGILVAEGDLDPDAKRARIEAMQKGGEVVAMVGDGINDAPPLAQAQVSISLASATPIAQWTADVVVLNDALAAVPQAVEHARRTLAVIRQNLAWASVYNAIAIPSAAFGLVTPLVAAIGMSLSSLAVVANAARLARVRAPAPRPFAAAEHRAPGRAVAAG